MKEKDIVNIHVREESRTDKNGNEWYKKMELEIRKQKPKKTLSTNSRRAIYLFVIVFLLVVGISSFGSGENRQPSSEELLQLVERIESTDPSIHLSTLWQD